MNTKFDPFLAFQHWMSQNQDITAVKDMYADIVGKRRQLLSTTISWKRQLTGTSLKMIEPNDTLNRGVIGLAEGKLKASQYVLIYGIQLRAAYHSSTAFSSDAALKAGDYSHLNAATSNKGLSNGFFDLSIGKKNRMSEHSMSIFATDGVTNSPAGYYAIPHPNLIGKPGEELEFDINDVTAPTDEVALALDYHMITTV